jgi:hypothetical protein
MPCNVYGEQQKSFVLLRALRALVVKKQHRNEETSMGPRIRSGVTASEYVMPGLTRHLINENTF